MRRVEVNAGSPADERDLLRRLRRGDQAALDTVFAAYFDRLYRFIYFRTAGDRQAAEDITQESLIAALNGLERFDGRAALYTWLCSIARHKIGDHFRRLQRLNELRAALTAEPDALDDPYEQTERAERREQVLTALRALPAHYQQALVLKYLDRVSGRELAAQLSISEDAAESLLARARNAFRRTYRERGAVSGGERMP